MFTVGRILALRKLFLECDNYRVIGYFKAGGKADDPGSNELDTLFKADTSKEKVFEFNDVANKFIEEKKVLNGVMVLSNGKEIGDIELITIS